MWDNAHGLTFLKTGRFLLGLPEYPARAERIHARTARRAAQSNIVNFTTFVLTRACTLRKRFIGEAGFQGRLMKKFGFSILPALLLGATMVSAPRPPGLLLPWAVERACAAFRRCVGNRRLPGGPVDHHEYAAADHSGEFR
jgi:hypothetical protein